MSTSKPGGPWACKYRPKHLGQVVGNTEHLRKLAEWLRDWDDVVLRGKTKVVEEDPQEAWRTFKPAPENINARACLVSGPPGIGKTTTCVLVAKVIGKYQVMEYNASDARSKAIIDQMSSSLAGSQTLKLGKNQSSSLQRAVIIMDECDGMAGGDKGGTKALQQMIKNTRNPIICICNDRNDPGIKDLATSCLDLKFKKPENAAVAKRIKAILEGEGNKRVDIQLIEAMVDACGQDIRQVLNQIQFFGNSAFGKGSQKDCQGSQSPFDACGRLFSGEDKPGKLMSIERKLDMFYIDTDIMPMMVQENYLRTWEKRSALVEVEDLQKMALAGELIAQADSMQGNWELMGSMAVIGTVYPAALMSAAGTSNFRVQFPAWLQKRSSMAKAERSVQDMYHRVRVRATLGRRELATSSYHVVLYERMLKPLIMGDAKQGAAMLAAYGLPREFFTEQAPTLRGTLGLEDGYRKVAAQTKNNLYQELNALTRKNAPEKRKREDNSGLKGGSGDAGAAEDADGDAAADGDEDDGMVIQHKAKKPKQAANSKTKTNGKAETKVDLGSWKSAASIEKAQALAKELERCKFKGLIPRFIEGQTIAVRRKILMSDLMGPWRRF